MQIMLPLCVAVMQPIAKSNCGTAMNQGKKFSEANVRFDTYKQKGSGFNFPVLIDGRISSSLAMSEVLKTVPIVAVDYVFINPDYRKEAEKWLKEEREKIITKKEVEKI